MNLSNIKTTDAERGARSRGQAYIRKLTGTECEIDFYFFGFQWRLWACEGGWLLRRLHPELPWLQLQEATPTGCEVPKFPACGPSLALKIAKESIFLHRYFKDTPIFNERNTDYRWIFKGVETTSGEAAA